MKAKINWLKLARKIKDILIEQLKGAAVKAALSKWIVPFIKWVGIPVLGGGLQWLGVLLVKTGFDKVMEPLVTMLYLHGFRVVVVRKERENALELKKAFEEGDIDDIIAANMDTYN